MAKYTDRLGREWEVEIPGFGAVVRLRKEAGIDLNAAGKIGREFAEMLIGDPERTIEGVWHLVKEQAEKKGVTRDDFLEAANDLDALRTALTEAVFDFFHQSRAAEMKALIPAMIAEGKDAILSGLRNLAGISPASAESAPAT